MSNPPRPLRDQALLDALELMDALQKACLLGLPDDPVVVSLHRAFALARERAAAAADAWVE